MQSTTASQASTLTSLGTRTTSAESNISTLQTTTANQATSITTLNSSVGTNTTAIQTEASTRATETGSLFSKYTVKIDTNGYVSGFGLASTANNDTPFSEFMVRADRFSIASPTGPGITPIVPFVVTTTSQVIDGTTVPPGVYINGAYIKGGTIQGSAIEGGTITNSKLINVSANKITGAALEATSYIESAAYIAGSQGWKIHANGTAEFAAASIRGQLTAGQIDTRNLTIKDASGNVLFGAGTNLAYTSITGTPTLGSLAYLNSVSAGNVSGLGTLATASSVNWNTQIINVPAFGGFAYLSTITDANISTYIAGAAIGNAYISDLNATKLTAGLIDAARLDATVINAKVTNIDAAVIGSGTLNTARIGTASIDTLQIAGSAVTVPLVATGAVGTSFGSSTSVSIKTSTFSFPAGTTITALFTALKIDYGAGDIEVILNVLYSDNSLLATFAGASTGRLIQTMGPPGDKVTATFSGQYTIASAGSYKVEAIISNPYGDSWKAEYCTVVALGAKR